MMWVKVTFILLICVLIASTSILNEAEQNAPQLTAILKYLNSNPNKIYDYKRGIFLNSQQKADIVEVTIDVEVACIVNYPGVPCSERVLTCNAFLQNNNNEYRVLSDVLCKPKRDISVENLDEHISVPTPYTQESKIELSHEAVSSEQNADFVAVKADSIPCVGCPFDLNTDVEGISSLVDTALKHIESERVQKHTAIKVIRLQQQVVAGIKFILTVEVAPTVCQKDVDSFSTNCPVDVNAGSSVCQIVFIQRPWVSMEKFIISNNCTISQEYTLENKRGERNDMSNEISTNPYTNKPYDEQPVAQNTGQGQMDTQRLADLESQILFMKPENVQPVLKHNVESNAYPRRVQYKEIIIENPTRNHLYTDNVKYTSEYEPVVATPDQISNIASTPLTVNRNYFTVMEQNGEDNANQVVSIIPTLANSQTNNLNQDLNGSLDEKKSNDFQETNISQKDIENIATQEYRRFVRELESTSSASSNSSESQESADESLDEAINPRRKRDSKSTSSHSSESHEDDKSDSILEEHKIQRRERELDNTNSHSSESGEDDNTEESIRFKRNAALNNVRIKRKDNDINDDNDNSSSSSSSSSSENDSKQDKKRKENTDNDNNNDNDSSSSSSSDDKTEEKKELVKKDDKNDSDSSSSSSESNSGEQNEVKNRDRRDRDIDADINVRKIKRSIGQLEKISQEEKFLVRDLADFAASSLDNIDDDNHKRVILQILGAKKLKLDGIYYHIILRLGISQCPENEEDEETCREKLFTNLTKFCKVLVHVEDDLSNPKVVKSQCQNIKKDDRDRNRTNYSRYRRHLLLGRYSDDSDTTHNFENTGFRKTRSISNEIILNKEDTDKFTTSKDNPENLGTIQKESSDNLKASQYLKDILTYLDNESGHYNKLKIEDIISVDKQVVAGELWRIKAEVTLSDCPQSTSTDPQLCNKLEGSESRTCVFKVWDRNWLPNGREVQATCGNESKPYSFRLKRSISGSKYIIPSSLNNDNEPNPKILEYIKTGLRYLDMRSNHETKYMLKNIKKASKHTVAGFLWHVKTEIVLSDCPKTVYMQHCEELEDGESKTCIFVIWERSWLAAGPQINITCDNDEQLYSVSPRTFELLNTSHMSDHLNMFSDFMIKYNKTYLDGNDYSYRFKVFRDNLNTIDLLNKYEQGTGQYGITQFTDLTTIEFSKSRGLRTDLRNENEVPFANADIPDIEIPTEFDWRQKGAVTGVKDQGSCGSCWAFSTTGNIEGQYAIKYGKLLEFSEQELVDCDKLDQGCNGGLMDNAYKTIEQIGGLETESDYPYDGEDEKCHFNKTKARVQLSGALNISHNEDDMAKWLVKNGPISIAINANAMQFYMGGISHPWKMLCNPKNLDHGVLIVGYGVHNYPKFNKTLPYWIVKNSWGTSWGEQGYYRVYRGDGTCGLNQTPSSAIVA